jgi:hypothetical protein
MPRRYVKSLLIRVKSPLKRGMKRLASLEMSLSPMTSWKKAFLRLLRQNVQKLHHSPTVTGKWGMPLLNSHQQLLIKKSPKWEHSIGIILKSPKREHSRGIIL